MITHTNEATGKGEHYSLQIGVQTGTATMEISIEFSQEAEN